MYTELNSDHMGLAHIVYLNNTVGGLSSSLISFQVTYASIVSTLMEQT